MILYFTINHHSISLVLYIAKSMANIRSKYLNTFKKFDHQYRIRTKNVFAEFVNFSFILKQYRFSYFVKNIIVTIIFMRVSV